MPTVKDLVSVEIEFEVVCDDCGTGLCSHTRMKGNVAYVPACPKCIAEKDYEIKEFQTTIKELENKIYKLENQ